MAPRWDDEHWLLALRGVQGEYRRILDTRKRLIREAAASDVKPARIAEAMGLTPGRISQILKENER